VNGQGAATSTGVFPAQAEPAEACVVRTMCGARAQLRHGGSLLTQPSDPLNAREEARRKARSPLKTKRTIYRTSAAPRRKTGRGRLCPPEMAWHTDPSSNL